jgi:hypothetical protein
MSLFKNIDSYFPTNGEETREYIEKAYDSFSPSFISLKSDPDLSKSITGDKK